MKIWIFRRLVCVYPDVLTNGSCYMYIALRITTKLFICNHIVIDTCIVS